MAKYSIILDPRVKKDGTTTVILSFIHRRYRRKINLGLSVDPSMWDVKTGEVSPQHRGGKAINQAIRFYRAAADTVILRHLHSDVDGETVFNQMVGAMFPDRVESPSGRGTRADTLPAVAWRLAEMKRPSTRLTYERTLVRLEGFIGSGHSARLDDVNRAWLVAFDNYLAQSNPSPNARALHLRNLRAVFNYAIDEGLTSNYPFRRFKIRTVRTAKRSLPVDTLRRLLSCQVEEWQELYRDMFALSFMLMGINFADLLGLRPGDLHDGRIEFNRRKTARLYSMKVEPEAMALIGKYAGEGHLLSVMDGRSDYVQFIRQTNNALRKIGDCRRSGRGGKREYDAICPELSTYWARHSWATIAASLDIPKETIAAALGHGGNSVTDIYIDFDRRKVDEANRRVLDWVLYGARREGPRI